MTLLIKSTKKLRFIVHLCEFFALTKFKGNITSTRECLLFISKYYSMIRLFLPDIALMIIGIIMFILIIVMVKVTPIALCNTMTPKDNIPGIIYIIGCVIFAWIWLKRKENKNKDNNNTKKDSINN